jgi:hypothetical protein
MSKRKKRAPVIPIQESSLFQLEDFKLEPPPVLPTVLKSGRKTGGLRAPAGISKSMAKAIACPSFFAGQYLQRGTIAVAEHFLAQTGIEFHDWRKAYVDHLVQIGEWSDPEFQEEYVRTHTLSEDGRSIILRDRFEVNPDSVYGTELFLSINHQFEALEETMDNAEPGRLSSRPDFLLSGTLDLLLLEGRMATIVDPKSGFSTTGVSDDEPAFYAALVFAHFPQVETVNFRWDFVRMSALRRTSYTRADLPWIHDRILQVNAAKDEAVRAYNAGEALDANPWSGMCPYCQIACPLRPRFEAGELALAMPQTRNDAVRLAQLVKVCEDVIGQARQLVTAWLDQDPEHVLPLGSGWEATLRVDDKSSYALAEALNKLGIGLVDLASLEPGMREMVLAQQPAYTPAFDVPLSGLQISGLSSYTKTKKSKKRADGGGVSREGMKEQLAVIAKRNASTTLLIRPKTTTTIAELLEASLDEAGFSTGT